MKLKKAVSLAIAAESLPSGTYWITSDRTGMLYLYERIEPKYYDNIWLGKGNATCLFRTYTGKKHWTKAIRKFEI